MLDRLPPKTEKGMRLLKGAVWLFIIFLLINGLLFGIMAVEGYKSGMIRNPQDHGFELKYEEPHKMGGVIGVTLRRYSATSGTYSVLNVFTYSYPIYKGLVDDMITDMSRRSAESSLSASYEIEAGERIEKQDRIGKYNAIVVYIDFKAYTYLGADMVIETDGKYIVASLSPRDAKVLGATSVVLVGYSITGEKIIIGSTVVYESYDAGTYNRMLEMMKEGFCVG